MGSGCNKTTRSGRPVNRTSDKGVFYTGPAIPSLGICTGDYLDEITAVIVQKLVDYATGEGISLPNTDFTQCAFLDSFTQCCVQDKDLQSIINGILKSFCTINTHITSIDTLITAIQNSINYTVIPGCLTVANSKIDTVLNKLISEYCTFVAKVTAIFGGSLDNPILSTTVTNQITDSVLNTVLNNIKGCAPGDVVKTGTGVNTIVTIKGVNPIGTILFGKWDSSYFDNTGLGLKSKGMCGYAVCNGVNGTDDWRGFIPGMATNISSSNALNPFVDSVVNGDADYATNIGDTKGLVKVKLTGPQSGLLAHTHSITQTPHNHTNGNFDRLLQHTGHKTLGPNDENDSNGREPVLDDSQPMLAANANITINANAAQNAEQSHENRQPTRYVNCIMRIA